jgi:hypothetical protein
MNSVCDATKPGCNLKTFVHVTSGVCDTLSFAIGLPCTTQPHRTLAITWRGRGSARLDLFFLAIVHHRLFLIKNQDPHAFSSLFATRWTVRQSSRVSTSSDAFIGIGFS